jgi:hypothetical protein
VEVEAVALVDDLAVPGQAQPADLGQDVVGQLGAVALGVGVLDAQQHLATLLPSDQPVEQHGARPTDVQPAGRRRREAQAR